MAVCPGGSTLEDELQEERGGTSRARPNPGFPGAWNQNPRGGESSLRMAGGSSRKEPTRRWGGWPDSSLCDLRILCLYPEERTQDRPGKIQRARVLPAEEMVHPSTKIDGGVVHPPSVLADCRYAGAFGQSGAICSAGGKRAPCLFN